MKKIFVLLFALIVSANVFAEYKPSSYDVYGIVAYEAKYSWFVIYTERYGHIIVQHYGYDLDEGDMVYGRFSTYGYVDIYNETKDEIVSIYIDNWGLSRDRAVEWLSDRGYLKDY